jgi:protein-S-isoprenylcysteine O-methyltransferase Ste14
MGLVAYLVSLFLLACVSSIVFRLVVRRDYRRKGRLTLLSGALELLVFVLYMGFPYLYNPPAWAWFWSPDVPVGTPLRIAGVICILCGMALAFGTMLGFGLGRAFGRRVTGLIQAGPYRFTRNPQLVGGSLLVIGSAVLWPSWYALGWAALYGFVAHVMVLTEEEHLRAAYGAQYVEYCAHVRRYLGVRRAPARLRSAP